MRLITFLTAVLTVAPLTTITAQDSLYVKLGDRVRVTHGCQTTARGEVRCEKTVATLAALGTDGMLLGDAEPYVEVSIGMVNTLEVSRGLKSHWLQGMGIGFLAGAGVGALAGTAVDCTEVLGTTSNEASCTGLYAAAGAASGLLIGGLVGGLVWRSDRWEEVPLDQLRVSLAHQRGGQFQLRFSLRF